MLIENGECLSNYFADAELETFFCALQFGQPTIFPLYLILNGDVKQTKETPFRYRCSGSVRFVTCTQNPGELKGRVECMMINSVRQYKEELLECRMLAGKEAVLELPKEKAPEVKEEPMSTFKLCLSAKELEDKLHIQGPFHTGETLPPAADRAHSDDGEDFDA